MPMLRKLAVLLALAGPVGAEPAGGPELTAALEGLTGVRVSAAPAGSEGGWCVLDRAVLKAEGAPDLAAGRLRLRGELAEGALVELALDAAGVQLAPGLGQRDLDPILRETFRLQTADVAFVVTAGPEGLILRDAALRLSGGTELRVEAEVAGAGLSAGSLLAGRLTRARLDWRNDGRLLRPALQAAGEALAPGAAGAKAVDAARAALDAVVAALPEAMLGDEGRKELAQLIDALPQGRGRLVLKVRSDRGIGAAEVALAAFAEDPAGPEALARLFAGSELTVDWVPGLAE